MIFTGIKRLNCYHFLITLFLVGSSGALAILIPDIESAFGFFGAFGAVFIGIYFPMIIKVKISDEPWNSPKNLIIIIVNIILSSVTGIAAIISAIKIVDPEF